MLRRLALALVLVLALATPTLPQPEQTCRITQTATGLASTAVTLTVPAGGSGLFFYICTIDISMVANAAVTGAAGPAPIFTTTNLQNNLVFWGDNSSLTIGQQRSIIQLAWPTGMRTSISNTAFTIVTSGGQATQNVRINVTGYYGL